MALPRLSKVLYTVGDWLSALIIILFAALLIIVPFLVWLLFLAAGIYLIVAGAGTGDGGQIIWGCLLCLLSVVFTWIWIRQ